MPDHEQLGTALPPPTGGAMFSRASLARIAPFVAYIGFIAVTDLLERYGVPLQELRWLYAVRIAVVLALLAVFWRDYDELRGDDVGRALTPGALGVAVVTGIVVLILWVSLNASWMQVGSPSGFNPTSGAQIDWLLVTVRIFGAAAVVPIMEELFWRSFLMRWIVAPEFRTVDPAQATFKSIAVTVLLFGFEHNLWLAGIVAGAAYSWLYVRYRTLWIPILAHAVTNFLLGIWVVHTGHWDYW